VGGYQIVVKEEIADFENLNGSMAPLFYPLENPPVETEWSFCRSGDSISAASQKALGNLPASELNLFKFQVSAFPPTPQPSTLDSRLSTQ
jgi:hypothetical protein